MKNVSTFQMLHSVCIVVVLISIWFCSGTDAIAGGHTNKAHYTFPNTNQFTQDVSSNGNNVSGFGGSGGVYYITNTPKEGPFAASFITNGTFNVAYFTPPTNLLSTFAGSFSLSLWLSTTNSAGTTNDTGAFSGQGVFTTFYTGGSANDIIPMALVSNKLAFFTGGSPNHTLRSVASVNTGDYVHLVVTRERSTGEKKIYVNGALDATGTGTTNTLNAPTALRVGANFNFNGLKGLIDDIQIYSGVLSASEIAQMYTNAGVIISNTTNVSVAMDLTNALDTTNLVWTSSGTFGTPWNYQTNVNNDGEDAAVSGIIGPDELTFVQTTVPTNGEVSFYWKVSSEEDFDYLIFYINGFEQDFLTGEIDWNQQSYEVFAGDTLRWEYIKDESGDEGDDRAWLDQVVFTEQLPPVSVGLRFTVQHDFLANDAFLVFPFLTSVSLPAITEHRVVSPTGLFSGTTNGSSATQLSSLTALINESTNTNKWKLYINKDHASQRIYTFSVSFSGLTSNLLTSPVIHSPTNGAGNVSTNAAFHWSGPAGYSSVFSSILWSNVGGGNATLAGTATNWPSQPTLNLGTNRLNVEYRSNNSVQAIFTTPLDASLNPIDGWTTVTELKTARSSIFTVATPPVAAQITNLNFAGGNFEFSFVTQAGKSHTILANTNLSTTNWVVLTNFTGNGALQQFSFPTTNPPARFFQVLTQ